MSLDCDSLWRVISDVTEISAATECFFKFSKQKPKTQVYIR